MPSNKTITPLLGGHYYHIYNRGINRGNIFFQTRNYDYFLHLLKKHIFNHVEILAYCLLPNHFHLLLRLSEKVEIIDKRNQTDEIIKDEAEIGKFVSEKFRRLFISYSQAINRQESRIGSLVTRNFKRIQIEDDEHLKYLFFYIHHNPVKHGICNDYKNYNFSSYKSYLSNTEHFVSIKHGLELFEGKENFIEFHNYFHNETENLHLE